MKHRNDWKHLVQVWFDYAKNTEDPFLRFLCYYMTLNHLFSLTGYKEEYDRSTGETEFRERTAFEGIPRLLKELLPIIQFEIDPLDIPTLSKPRQRCGTRWNDKDKCWEKFIRTRNSWRLKQAPNIRTNDRMWDTIDIFLKISIVRNNLFHGWKTPEGPEYGIDETDVLLIKESVAVLEQFLKQVLKLDHLPVILDELAEQSRRVTQ